MDIIVVILVLAAVAVMIFKKFSNTIYYIVIVDIFLKILAFIASSLPIKVITDFITKYFPSGVDAIIKHYSSGIFETVLLWLLLAIYIIFEYYIIRTFFKKK